MVPFGALLFGILSLSVLTTASPGKHKLLYGYRGVQPKSSALSDIYQDMNSNIPDPIDWGVTCLTTKYGQACKGTSECNEKGVLISLTNQCNKVCSCERVETQPLARNNGGASRGFNNGASRAVNNGASRGGKGGASMRGKGGASRGGKGGAPQRGKGGASRGGKSGSSLDIKGGASQGGESGGLQEGYSGTSQRGNGDASQGGNDGASRGAVEEAEKDGWVYIMKNRA